MLACRKHIRKPEHTLLFSTDRHGHMYLHMYMYDVCRVCGCQDGKRENKDIKNLFSSEWVKWNVSYIQALNFNNTWCSLSWCINSQSLNRSCCAYWGYFLLTTLIVCWSRWLREVWPVHLFSNILPIFSRMSDRRCGHPPAVKPSGPEWTGLPGPPVRGCQSLRSPQQTGQALPGSGLHAG